MALAPSVVAVARKVRPDLATLVPERRQELTTEGGLDVVKYYKRVKDVTQFLRRKNIEVSRFIGTDRLQIARSFECGVDAIELHTGEYALAKTKDETRKELNSLKKATHFARSLGLIVNAGHGLKYHNTKPVAQIDGVEELNIGHSIISRAVFVGLKEAVREMRKIVS